MIPVAMVVLPTPLRTPAMTTVGGIGLYLRNTFWKINAKSIGLPDMPSFIHKLSWLTEIR